MKRTLATAAILAAALSSATALASADAATAHHATTTQRAAHAYKVVAKASQTEPLVNDKVKIKATVSPGAPGAQVMLQVKYQDQKQWKTIGHKALKSGGKVTFKDKVTSVRSRKYRVVKPADSRGAAGSGETAKVTVFGWRTLTSLSPVNALGMFESSSASLNGVSYPDSIIGPGPAAGHIDYNLNRDCKQLDAVYGLSDSSAAGGSTTLTLTADGVQKHSAPYALTQAQRVVTDVTGVFRISISYGPLGGGIAAVASPKVLCSF